MGATIVFAGGRESALRVSAGGMMDFRTVAWSSSVSGVYTPNAAGTAGTLTISGGVGSASISLLGQYAAAGFTLSSDGAGGTLVTYSPPTSTILLAGSH